MTCPVTTALAGVMGDGKPLAAPTPLIRLGIFWWLAGSSAASLLGAGVKLLLGPRVAGLVDAGNFEPLIIGKLYESIVEVLGVFFWKKPVIDF